MREKRRETRIEFGATSNSVLTGISRKGAQLSEVCWIARGTNYLFNGGLPTSLGGSGLGRKDGVVPRGRGEREDRWKRKTTYDVVSDSGQASRRPTVFPKTVCYEAVQVTNRCTSWPHDLLLLPGDKRFLTKFRRDSGSYHYDPIVSS